MKYPSGGKPILKYSKCKLFTAYPPNSGLSLQRGLQQVCNEGLEGLTRKLDLSCRGQAATNPARSGILKYFYNWWSAAYPVPREQPSKALDYELEMVRILSPGCS